MGWDWFNPRPNNLLAGAHRIAERFAAPRGGGAGAKGEFMKKASILAAASFAVLAGTSAAHATSITGFGDPLSNSALAGGQQLDFSNVPTGSYASFTRAGVTFSGNGRIFVDGTHAGSYNTTGRYLQNNSGGTNVLTFSFADAVSAFAFNFGATDGSWTLAAYAGATLVDSLTFGPIFSSNARQYYGIAGNGITSATLTRREPATTSCSTISPSTGPPRAPRFPNPRPG